MFKLSTKILKSFYLQPFKRTFSNVIPLKTDSSSPFASTVYIEQMYNIWLQNPEKVDRSWHDYFKEIQAEELLETKKANLEEEVRELTPEEKEKMRSDVIKIYFYVRSFNKRGHELANLDPLSNIFYLNLSF